MKNKQWDTLWINGQVVTMDNDFGLIKNGAVATKNGKIAWLGSTSELPDLPENLSTTINNLEGRCLTPGLIDCHTHLIYAGNRAAEFEMRLNGATYSDIAKAGGGILSTVAATRVATEEELFAQSFVRAKALISEGVTTLEIKSGYGLDLETELKILRVAKKIGENLPVTISSTFLGAHTLPSEYKEKPDAYIDLICEEMLPIIAEEKLAQQVDVFCENIAFNLAQTERVFKCARELGFGIKCHAEQLSDLGASGLAADYKALSVDHLEFLSQDNIEKLSKSETVAVLLPGAFYYLRETKLPPVQLLREHKVPIAIATDCNPGTSPLTSILLTLNMACVLFKLTPLEAFAGITRNAAKALGLDNTCGTLTCGKNADFCIWDVKHPCELTYWIGYNPLAITVKQGKIVFFKK